MVRIKCRQGFIKFISETSEMNAQRWFLLQRLIILANCNNLERSLKRVVQHIKNDRKQYAMEEILLCHNSIFYAKQGFNPELAILSCLQATNAPKDEEEAFRRGKWLESQINDVSEAFKLISDVKKKFWERLGQHLSIISIH